MVPLIEKNRAELADLCRRFRVKTLELFGSAANGTFDPDRSDLDFLVDYLPLPAGEHSRAYFGMLLGLEDLFQRKIDLVETRAVTNPYFVASVDRNRTVLYAANSEGQGHV
jgi:predicted nucleotidyltransferase